MTAHLQRLGGWAGALAFAITATAATPRPARASSWGCEVILCLATPGSPTTYAACVPPIVKLWKSLATGHVFPTCSEGGVSTRTRKIKDGYALQVTQADGTQARYVIDTKRQTITQP